MHFGRTEPPIVASLVDAVQAIHPNLVVISGDLTQRARTEEFEQARDFLAALPKPQLVIPGNHDVPLHNIYDRFLRSLTRYQSYISADLEPFYSDDEIAVAGISTARSLVVKNGSISLAQIARIEERFSRVRKHVVKVVVTHHPVDLPPQFERRDLVKRATIALPRLARSGLDLLLAGHYHVSFAGGTATRYPIAGYSAVFVQAGTACSTRSRGERNAFNCITIDRDRIIVETHEYCEGTGFRPKLSQHFRRTSLGWQPCGAEVAAGKCIDEENV